MKSFKPRSGLLACAAFLSLLAVPLAASELEVERADSRLPRVPLGSLEEAVAEQLGELRELARADLESGAARAADSVGELGRHYHAYGLGEAARECYELAAALAPRDFRWPYLAAYIAQGEGRHEDAIALYEKALAIVPGVSPTLVRLAAVHAELGNADRAEWLFREAIKANPTSAAALAGLGELLLARDRPEEAIPLLEQALDLAREANRLYYPLAQAYRKLGEEETARELLAWSGKVGVKPADPLIDSLVDLKTGERAYLLQGQSAFRVGRYSEAAEQFRRALAVEPDSVAALINLGSALGQMAEAEEAIRVFERAVELAPGNETALFNLGVLLSRKGEFDRAIDSLSQAGQFAPVDGEIRFELAQALRLQGRFEDSLLHFDAAIQAFPDREGPWLGKAQSLARLERQTELSATLEAAVKTLPGSVALAQALSRLLALADDPEMRDGARAVQLALEVFEARQQLADAEWVSEALALAGQCEQAASWQRKVVEQAKEAEQVAVVVSRLEQGLARYEQGSPCSLSSPAP